MSVGNVAAVPKVTGYAADVCGIGGNLFGLGADYITLHRAT